MNLLDNFANRHRDGNVAVFLATGVKLTGRIEDVDERHILLVNKEAGRTEETLVFNSAVSSIVEAKEPPA